MDELCWKQNRSTGGVEHDIDKFVKVIFMSEVREVLKESCEKQKVSQEEKFNVKSKKEVGEGDVRIETSEK